MRTAFAVAILLVGTTPSSAHRLDEYLQGTIISVEKNRILVQMTLTPGVAVFPFLIAQITAGAGGVISETEQRVYAGRVLHDLTLEIDGRRLTPQLLSVQFPSVNDMKEGSGEIQLDFHADLPPGGRSRKLTFENHHQSRISAYQVNCLVPRDPDIRIAAQARNYSQSVYHLEYMQAGIHSDPSSFALWSDRLGWLGGISLLLFTRLVLLWRRANMRSVRGT